MHIFKSSWTFELWLSGKPIRILCSPWNLMIMGSDHHQTDLLLQFAWLQCLIQCLLLISCYHIEQWSFSHIYWLTCLRWIWNWNMAQHATIIFQIAAAVLASLSWESHKEKLIGCFLHGRQTMLGTHLEWISEGISTKSWSFIERFSGIHGL